MNLIEKNKADKPVVKSDFAFKGGNSGGCGTLMLALVGICAFFIIKWIAPFLIAGCFVFGMR